MSRSGLLLLALLCGCKTFSQYSNFSVGVGTDPISHAVTSSATSRANGGCYANCQSGSVCNRKTGVCDPLPCRGECAPNERCQRDRCVPAAELEIQRAPAR